MLYCLITSPLLLVAIAFIGGGTFACHKMLESKPLVIKGTYIHTYIHTYTHPYKQKINKQQTNILHYIYIHIYIYTHTHIHI